MATLKTNILGIEFENPFILASAPPTALVPSIEKAFEMGWGGAVLKTIHPDSMSIDDVSPRYEVIRSAKGEITGFQNIELLSHQTVRYWCDGIKYLKEKYPEKVIIASIMAPVKKEEWQKLVKTLNNTPIDAFELNFSCPHGMPERNIGMAIGTSTDLSILITCWVKAVAKKPVFVKLTPNVTDISVMAKCVASAGADGISAINTVLGFMGVDLDSLTPKLSVNGYSAFGGCSGEMVKPIGLRSTAMIRQELDLPILGMGGISTWQDAAEYISLGANAVEICTSVMLNGYGIIKSLKKGLLEYLESKGFDSPNELQGKALNRIVDHKALDRNYKLIPTFDGSKCVLCGKCLTICDESEHQAISLDKDKMVVSKENCVGCSLCHLVCPKGAITMVQR